MSDHEDGGDGGNGNGGGARGGANGGRGGRGGGAGPAHRQLIYANVPNLPEKDKLVGAANYPTWKFIMQNLLIEAGLWDCVSVPDDEDLEDDPALCARALAKICLNVKSNIYPELQGLMSPRDAWATLEQRYEEKGYARKYALKRRLYGIKLAEFDSMEAYINEIKSISQTLSDIGAPVADEDLANMMLQGLPDELSIVATGLEAVNEELSTEIVVRKLQSLNIAQGKPGTSSASALWVKGPNSGKFNGAKGKASKTSKNVICYYCKKPGHLKSECQALKKRNSKQKHDNKAMTSTNQCHCNCSNSSIANSTGESHTSMLVRSAISSSPSSNAAVIQPTVDAEPNPVASVASAKPETTTWAVDSGADKHMCNDEDCFSELDSSKSSKVSVANNDIIESKGIGRVPLVFENNDHRVLENTLFVPHLSMNLISVPVLDDMGFEVRFKEQKCTILKDNVEPIVIPKVNGLYRITLPVAKCLAAVTRKGQDSHLWHRRLGHLSYAGMRLLQATHHLSIGKECSDCEICIRGKMPSLKFPISSFRADCVLALVHTDICGPFRQPSLGGARYFVTFTDDFSRKVFVYTLKTKCEVFDKFVHFKTMMEKQTGHVLKCIRSDNAKEYTSRKFKTFCEQHGIVHQLSVEYTPQQSGTAERMNRTLLDRARCMLFQAEMGPQFWAEAISTAAYLRNRSPCRAVNNQLPEEIWRGHKVNLSHLKVFGCLAYVKTPEVLRSKLDEKAKPHVFVGYCEESKAYRLLPLSNLHTVKKARDVHFLEEKPVQGLDAVTVMESSDDPVEEYSVTMIEILKPVQQEQPNQDNGSHLDESLNNSSSSDSTVEDSVENPNPEMEQAGRYPRRQHTAPKRYDDYILYANLACTFNVSVQQALKGPESTEWKSSMEEEYQSLMENKTWTLVDRPSDTNVIKCKWVLRKKEISSGIRHKARLVARGFSQIEGVDYFETYSPVVRLSTIRMMLALSIESNFVIHHVDVTTAFLHGTLSETIYMEQPPEFISDPSKVCLLKKAIYGLKQSSRVWNQRIHSFLISLGFSRSNYDECLYFKRDQDVVIYIALYVDDFFIFSNSDALVDFLKLHLSNNFKIRDLGLASEILGMRLRRSPGCLSIDQQRYCEDLINRFKTDYGALFPATTPLVTGQLLQPGDVAAPVPYQEFVGGIMYLSVATRPDLSFPISYLSQFNNCPTEEHWQALKRLLGYISRTKHLSICFRNKQPKLHAFSDANFGDMVDGKSYSGYVLLLAGGAISWESRKQKCVARSSAEAEYVTLSECACEVIYLRNFLCEITSIPHDAPTVIFCDSQSAAKLASVPGFRKKTKHILIKYHHVRDEVENCTINICYMHTSKMPADMLNKAVPRPKLELCIDAIGMQSIV